MVAHSFCLSIWEADAGRSSKFRPALFSYQVPGHPGIIRLNLQIKYNNNNNNNNNNNVYTMCHFCLSFKWEVAFPSQI
jgi:hypothetical protein